MNSAYTWRPINRADNEGFNCLVAGVGFWATTKTTTPQTTHTYTHIDTNITHTFTNNTHWLFKRFAVALLLCIVRPMSNVPVRAEFMPQPTANSRSGSHVHLCVSHCGIYCLPFVSKVLWHWCMNKYWFNVGCPTVRLSNSELLGFLVCQV